MVLTKTFKSLFFLLFLFLPSYGMDFMIKPVRIFMENGKNTAVFEIQNLSDKKITIETEAKKWTQNQKGEDILEDTEDIIVIPPYIELKAKQRQLIKLAYLGDPPLDKQLTYRMILKQLPEPIKEKEKSDKVKTVLQVVFHISVPIFINPLNKELKYDLHISKVYINKENAVFHVENSGNQYARIVGITFFRDNRVIFGKKLVKYVLPGKSFDITIENEKIKDNNKKDNSTLFDILPDKAKIFLEDRNVIEIPL